MIDNKLNLKVYIINLKKDTVKKQYMQQLCHKYNIDVEFINAVYGEDLSKNEINRVYDAAKSQRLFKRELTLAEIGCALSHLYVYKKILKAEIKTALILEDDINFDEKLLTFFSSLNKLPKQWEVVLLGHHSKYSRGMPTAGSFWSRVKIFDNYKIEIPVEQGYGAYGYVINTRGAEKLLNHLKTIIYPIDYFTGNKEYVNIFLLNKPIIDINERLTEEYTSMQERNNKKKNFKGLVMSVLAQYKMVDLMLFLLKLKKIKVYK